MKWQKRSAGKLHFLTKTLGKTPKNVKNGYFWSFCDPHGQPLHPTVQDLVQIVRPTTIFNNSEAKMLRFSFFFIIFLPFSWVSSKTLIFGLFTPLVTPHGWPHGLIMTNAHLHVGCAQSGPQTNTGKQPSGIFRFLKMSGKISLLPPFGGSKPNFLALGVSLGCIGNEYNLKICFRIVQTTIWPTDSMIQTLFHMWGTLVPHSFNVMLIMHLTL